MKRAITEMGSSLTPFNTAKWIGRPPLGESRRTAISITVIPELVQAFDRWAYENDLSRSRGVEMAMTALLTGDKDAKV